MTDVIERLKEWACAHPEWTDTFIQNPCAHSQRARDIAALIRVAEQQHEALEAAGVTFSNHYCGDGLARSDGLDAALEAGREIGL